MALWCLVSVFFPSIELVVSLREDDENETVTATFTLSREHSVARRGKKKNNLLYEASNNGEAGNQSFGSGLKAYK